MNTLELLRDGLIADRAEADMLRKTYGERKTHWPSSASCWLDGKVVGGCLRNQYYSWTDTPKSEVEDIWGEIKMKLGKAGEKWAQGVIHRQVYRLGGMAWENVKRRILLLGCVNECSAETDQEILLYEFDEELYDYLTPEQFIPEFKTAFGQGGFALAATGPALHRVLQLGIYAHIRKIRGDLLHMNFNTGWPQLDTVTERAGQVYLNGKATGLWLFDNVGSVAARWAILETALATRTLPPADFDHENLFVIRTGERKKTNSPFQCAYCSWLTICRRTDKSFPLTTPGK